MQLLDLCLYQNNGNKYVSENLVSIICCIPF